MSAIFTGLGSGFAKSSATTLGAAGTFGSAATGRAGEGISVNAATGNLVISRRDEFLSGRGLDVGISRTYNSLAEVHDGDNGDQWQMSTARRVFGLTGALNTAGSTITRVSGDGSVVTYTYESRDGVASYWATDGSGTHDRMWTSGGNWYWRDGDSRVTEGYTNYAGEFRLASQADRDGRAVVFGWSGDKLSYVKTNNNEYVHYTWSDDKLTSIQTEFVDPKLGTSTRSRPAPIMPTIAMAASPRSPSTFRPKAPAPVMVTPILSATSMRARAASSARRKAMAAGPTSPTTAVGSPS